MELPPNCPTRPPTPSELGVDISPGGLKGGLVVTREVAVPIARLQNRPTVVIVTPVNFRFRTKPTGLLNIPPKAWGTGVAQPGRYARTSWDFLGYGCRLRFQIVQIRNWGAAAG